MTTSQRIDRAAGLLDEAHSVLASLGYLLPPGLLRAVGAAADELGDMADATQAPTPALVIDLTRLAH